MSFGSLWVITINWIWEVIKETIIILAKLINMKKTWLLINLSNGSWGEGGPFPAYILPPQLPLSVISTDLWPRFASQIVDTNVLYLLSPITYPFDLFGHFPSWLDLLCVQVVEVVVEAGGIGEQGGQARKVSVQESVKYVESLNLWWMWWVICYGWQNSNSPKLPLW